jgi:MFS family permease
VVLAYAGFTVAEYGVWIGMMVYAYDQGGATTAGLVAIAQLIPAAIVAPLVAPIADRRSPVLLLAGGYAVQALGSLLTAIAIFTGLAPMWAYLGAVLASTAVSTTRPAQSSLVPALTREPEELTGANVVVGWMESLGILVAGGLVGVLLTISNVATVFAVCAAVLAAATLAVARLPVAAPQHDAPTSGIIGHLRAGLAETKRSPASRLLVALLVIEFIAGGALDVLFVVLAVDILQAGEAWTGYLNMAYGFGGLVLGALAAFFVGRRLGPVILTAALALGLALAATAITSNLVLAVVLLAVVGGSRALFEVRPTAPGKSSFGKATRVTSTTPSPTGPCRFSGMPVHSVTSVAVTASGRWPCWATDSEPRRPRPRLRRPCTRSTATRS